jgi:orotidine-5'-phosphate decarboxylase
MSAEIIVALDIPSADLVKPTVSLLPPEISFFKVGLQLFIAEGEAAMGWLAENEKNTFLDLKLHDIPKTVANAVQSAGKFSVKLLTVHACGGSDMLRAAADAAAEFGDDRPQVIAVTTLTSLSQEDLTDIGVTRQLKDNSLKLAELALKSGIDGLVCSPLETAAFRREFGPDPIIVTPGVRPAGSAVADQKRIATPADAVKAGASYLVIGRPILQADDPAAASRAILDEIASVS